MVQNFTKIRIPENEMPTYSKQQRRSGCCLLRVAFYASGMGEKLEIFEF